MQEEQKTQVPETNQPIANVATKEKMSKKQIIGMTILSLIAVAGVVFGVFGMTDSNSKNQEIERLKVQITEAAGGKTELETDQITITDPDGTTTEITDTVAPTVNSSDYIYVGEWGIKIKIPENLSEVSYIYGNGYFGYLCLTGAKYDGQQYGPEFLDIEKTRLGCVRRVANYQTTIGDREFDSAYAVYKEGDYFWVYEGPQALHSESEDEQQWEYASSQLIKEMLENSNNYSKI